jgi:hypothetical protein
MKWWTTHDRKQYGGVNGQREVVRMIGHSLGLSYPEGRPWHPDITTNNSIIATTPSEPNENLGHTFFFADDDHNALKTLYGSSPSDIITGQSVIHRQRAEEDFLIGRNGQRDIFQLVAKGINYNNKDAFVDRGEDKYGRLWWHNDYVIPSVANFNPAEGDKILIQKRLFVPYSPIYPDTPNSSIPKKFDFSGKKVATKSFLKKLRIRFQDDQPLRALPGDQQGAVMTSSANLNINGAGKLMINANGTDPQMGPYSDDLTVNAQLLAFLDVYGPFGPAIKGEWFGLF